MPSPVREYHESIRRADDGRGPGGLGWGSPVVELLQEEAVARAQGRPRLKWRLVDRIRGERWIEIWEIMPIDAGSVRRSPRKKLKKGVRTDDDRKH